MSINVSKLPASKWNVWVLKQTREHSTALPNFLESIWWGSGNWTRYLHPQIMFTGGSSDYIRLAWYNLTRFLLSSCWKMFKCYKKICTQDLQLISCYRPGWLGGSAPHSSVLGRYSYHISRKTPAISNEVLSIFSQQCVATATLRFLSNVSFCNHSSTWCYEHREITQRKSGTSSIPNASWLCPWFVICRHKTEY
jgi:hypothetical protein